MVKSFLVTKQNDIILNAIVLNTMAFVLFSLLHQTSSKIIYKIDLSSGLYG